MKTIKQDFCYKGTVIRLGNEKRTFLNQAIADLIGRNYTEISIPIIQSVSIFEGKVGEENNNMMYNFKDRGDRDICLAPEYTAVIQKLAQTEFKKQKDVKVFYVAECFRGEKPQKGRWRQFTQLGVEVINPSDKVDYKVVLGHLAMVLIRPIFPYNDVELNYNVTRGLDYYEEGKGFEIRTKDGLQLCGGGSYEGGIGFAIGVDRLFV